MEWNGCGPVRGVRERREARTAPSTQDPTEGWRSFAGGGTNTFAFRGAATVLSTYRILYPRQ